MKLIDDLKSSNASLYICCTGGGSGIQDILWQEPGTSSFLVGASFPYSKEEFNSFIGFNKKEKYFSQKGAIELAMASYVKAREYCIQNPGKDNPIGIGLSAACTTDRDRKGFNGVFVATVNKFGIKTAFVGFPSTHLDIDIQRKYSRKDDGIFVDNIAKAAIADSIGKVLYIGHIYNTEELIGNYQKINERWISLVMKDFFPQEARELFFEHPYYCSSGIKSETPIFLGQTIFQPGSYNPIHDGHRDIWWKTTNLTHVYPKYMITCDSVHKKALSVSEMLDRVAMIRLERFGIYKNVSVLFTQNDPLFIDKAKKFPNCSFVIGYDTAERMLDPKWGPEIIPMLHEFRRYGTKFYICGRIINGELKTIRDLSYPSYFSDIFIEVPGTGTDHSSTEIRKANV